MAKIELKSKPIQRFEFMGKYAPQHLYIVHTKDNGEQIAFRGGPEQGNYHKNIEGMPFRDNLKVTKLPYNNKHPDHPEKEGVLHPTALILEGSDQLIDPYVSKIESRPMRWINDGNFDYKVLLGQNSNAAARELIEGVGLKFALPKYEDDAEAIAPQWDATIEHSVIDKAGLGEKYLALYDKCGELSKKHDEKVAKIREEIQERMHKEEEKIDKKIAEATAMLNSAKTALTTEGAEAPRNIEQDYCNLGANMADSSKVDFDDLIKTLVAAINTLKKDKGKASDNLKEEEKEKIKDAVLEHKKSLQAVYNDAMLAIKQQEEAEIEEKKREIDKKTAKLMNDANNIPVEWKDIGNGLKAQDFVGRHKKVAELRMQITNDRSEELAKLAEDSKGKKTKEAYKAKLEEYNKDLETGIKHILNTHTSVDNIDEATKFIAHSFDFSFLDFKNNPFEETLYNLKKNAKQTLNEKVKSTKSEDMSKLESEFEERKKEIIDRKQKDLAEAWKNLPQECKTKSIAPGINQIICSKPEEHDLALRHSFGLYYPWEKKVQEQLQTELEKLDEEFKGKKEGNYNNLVNTVKKDSLEASNDLLQSMERAFTWEVNQAGWDLLTPDLDNLELEIQQMLKDFKPSDEHLHTEL